VPAELHANLMQWLIRLRYTLCLLGGDLVCTDLSGTAESSQPLYSIDM
jgi:hypothetical protein